MILVTDEKTLDVNYSHRFPLIWHYRIISFIHFRGASKWLRSIPNICLRKIRIRFLNFLMENKTPSKIISRLFPENDKKWREGKNSLINLRQEVSLCSNSASIQFHKFFWHICINMKGWNWGLKDILTFEINIFPKTIISLTSGDYKHVKYSQNWSRKIHKQFPKKTAICSRLHHFMMSIILTMKIVNQIHSFQHIFFPDIHLLTTVVM